MVKIPTETFLNLSTIKQKRIIEAAINEFSVRSYDEGKVSNIIKEANIPRGSFYQYFEDKKDLYKYLFSKIADEKIVYMQDLLDNKERLPFLELFRKLYYAGVIFAIDNPKYVRLMELLIFSRNEIYEELIEENKEKALQYYRNYIDADKELGIINKEIDTNVLAILVYKMTANVVPSQIVDDQGFNQENVINMIDKFIDIFKKGILSGE